MTNKELKDIWESTILLTDSNAFYCMDLDKKIALYSFDKNTLIIELKDEYYNDSFFKEYLLEFITHTIIANALDFEYGITKFELKFEGKTLKKAAI